MRWEEAKPKKKKREEIQSKKGAITEKPRREDPRGLDGRDRIRGVWCPVGDYLPIGNTRQRTPSAQLFLCE